MLKGIVPNHCTTNPGHKFMSLCIHEFGELGKELVQRFFFFFDGSRLETILKRKAFFKFYLHPKYKNITAKNIC